MILYDCKLQEYRSSDIAGGKKGNLNLTTAAQDTYHHRDAGHDVHERALITKNPKVYCDSDQTDEVTTR